MNSWALAATAAATISSLRRAVAPIGDVVGDAQGQQERVLEHDGGLPAEAGETDPAADRPRRESPPLPRDRRNAAPARRGCSCPRRWCRPGLRSQPDLQLEGDPSEHWIARLVSEGHVAKDQDARLPLPLHGGNGRASGESRTTSVGVEDLQHPIDARLRRAQAGVGVRGARGRPPRGSSRRPGRPGGCRPTARRPSTRWPPIQEDQSRPKGNKDPGHQVVSCW
jgi:hypothetical protein